MVNYFEKGFKRIYSILNKYHQTPESGNECNQIFSELNLEKISCKPVLTTKDTQLRCFEYRIPHTLLQTEFYLCVRKLTENPCVVMAAMKKTHYFIYFGSVQFILFGLMLVHYLKEYTSQTEHAFDLVWH